MSDQDIFQEKNQSSPASDQIGENQNPEGSTSSPEDLLRTIRNPETGEPKYKSIDDALKALKHAQEFIPSLQQENKTYLEELQQAREELQKSAGAMDALDRLAQPQPSQGSTPAPKEIDGRDIEGLVEKALQKKQTQAQQKTNVDKVKSALQEKYGDKAGQHFYQKAEELGLDRKTMNELAAKSPNAVLKYFEGEAGSNVTPSTSTVKSEGMKAPERPKGPLAPPSKSMMAGANTKDLVEELRRHRAAVYEKYGITE